MSDVPDGIADWEDMKHIYTIIDGELVPIVGFIDRPVDDDAKLADMFGHMSAPLQWHPIVLLVEAFMAGYGLALDDMANTPDDDAT